VGRVIIGMPVSRPEDGHDSPSATASLWTTNGAPSPA
jgi:hypothetical protein